MYYNASPPLIFRCPSFPFSPLSSCFLLPFLPVFSGFFPFSVAIPSRFLRLLFFLLLSVFSFPVFCGHSFRFLGFAPVCSGPFFFPWPFLSVFSSSFPFSQISSRSPWLLLPVVSNGLPPLTSWRGREAAVAVTASWKKYYRVPDGFTGATFSSSSARHK